MVWPIRLALCVGLGAEVVGCLGLAIANARVKDSPVERWVMAPAYIVLASIAGLVLYSLLAFG